jgi:hypothetical protein
MNERQIDEGRATKRIERIESNAKVTKGRKKSKNFEEGGRGLKTVEGIQRRWMNNLIRSNDTVPKTCASSRKGEET